MGSDSKVYHFDEVARHKYKKDCWIIVSGKVYDVTPFLEEHPGGDEVLMLSADKDATDDFNDVGHSDDAREMMEKYYIGEVDTSTIREQPNYKLPAQTTATQESSGFLVKLLPFLLPLLILGGAFALQYYNTKSNDIFINQHQNHHQQRLLNQQQDLHQRQQLLLQRQECLYQQQLPHNNNRKQHLHKQQVQQQQLLQQQHLHLQQQLLHQQQQLLHQQQQLQNRQQHLLIQQHLHQQQLLQQHLH